MDRSQEGYDDAELRPAECGGAPHGCAAPDDEESLRRAAEADGGEVEEVRNALFFDSTAGSWASRHKQCIAVIGGHKFYQ